MIAFNVAVAALVVATLAMIANVWSVFRTGQWRNSDDGKAVSTKIAGINDRMTVVETTLKSMPSASDVATLTEVSRSNHALLLITRSQLERLEGFFYGEKR